MTKSVPLVEAKARFSAIIDEVLHDSEQYVVERRGRAVAAIVPIAELERIQASQPTSRRPAGALALLGAWDDVDDGVLDAFVEDIARTRASDTGRPVHLEP